MDKKTPIRHFRCDDETWEALERVGKEMERTQSWMTRKAIQEYIDRYRASKRAEKAAADVDLERSDRKPVVASRRERKR
jgi:predicted transcriptional regulator